MVPLMGLVSKNVALNNIAYLPHKLRARLIKKAKALILNPRPQGAKRLKGITTEDGDPIYRQRSGDYRILYIIRENPSEVIVLDIDNRKDVYK